MPDPAERKKAARFLQTVVRKGLIDTAQARTVLTRVDRGEGPPEALLVADGLLTDHVVETINKAIAAEDGPKRIGGYRIVGKLGQGGMGAVYKAVQESIERDVALKIIPRQLMSDPGLRERFLREGRAAGKVNDPNVITVHDVGEDGGRLFMAMELVMGGDAEHLARKHGGKLPERRALRVIRDACKGLCAVHAAGLVHRDIKPANILLTPAGQAKLADLGLARSDAGDDRLTMTGTTIGTPSYMSPEQANGEADIDIRADIYSLGATLYALLCGEPPFTGPTPFSVVAQVINEPTPDPRQVNPAISRGAATLVMRAMAKRPDQRYATPDELLDALDAVIGGGAPPGGAPTRSLGGLLQDRRVQLAAFAGGAVLVVLLGIFLVWLLGGPGEQPTTPAGPGADQVVEGMIPAGDPPPPIPPQTLTPIPPPLPPPPPPGGLEPQLRYAGGIAFARPAQSCRLLERGILGRFYHCEALPGPRTLVDAALQRFGREFGLPFDDLVRTTTRLAFRLVTDDRVRPVNPDHAVMETVLVNPEHHDLMWTRLAAALGKPAGSEVLAIEDSFFTRVDEGLRALGNAARLPAPCEAFHPVPGDYDAHLFINPLLAAFKGDPPPERGIPPELMERLHLEAFLHLEERGDQVEVLLPGIHGSLPPPDRSIIRFSPRNLYGLCLLGIDGHQLLELLEWRDLIDGKDRLDRYRRECQRQGLPDVDAALGGYRGTLFATISEGAHLPHLLVAFVGNPEIDRHVQRWLGLEREAMLAMKEAPVALPEALGPWTVFVTRVDEHWLFGTDRDHLRMMQTRKPLRRPGEGRFGHRIQPGDRPRLPRVEELVRKIAEKNPFVEGLMVQLDDHLEPGHERVGLINLQTRSLVEEFLPLLAQEAAQERGVRRQRLQAVHDFLKAEADGFETTRIDVITGPGGLVLRCANLFQWTLLPAVGIAIDGP